MSIVNISAYKFISLDDLPALRERLLACCQALELKGTILLAPEGINLFLAGTRGQIDGFIVNLREDPHFSNIVPTESCSHSVPFRRLRIRLKREIITMRAPAIRPENGRAPALEASILRRWLDRGHDDDGREVVLLDARNDYETDVGMFPQAIDYRLASFTDFPRAIAADRARYAGKTVVSYCTGGIRCEKAALHMAALGMDHVYQLEGGILKYLEQTDARHWQGECFVFDGRGAVGTDLLPLPCGERTGMRGRAGVERTSKQALSEPAASSARSPQSAAIAPRIALPPASMQASPRRGEEANARSATLDGSVANRTLSSARSAKLDESVASPAPYPQSSPEGRGSERNKRVTS
jgi:UPF0176 protein